LKTEKIALQYKLPFPIVEKVDTEYPIALKPARWQMESAETKKKGISYLREGLRLIQLTADHHISSSMQIPHGNYILDFPRTEPHGHIQVKPTEETTEVMYQRWSDFT